MVTFPLKILASLPQSLNKPNYTFMIKGFPYGKIEVKTKMKQCYITVKVVPSFDDLCDQIVFVKFLTLCTHL